MIAYCVLDQKNIPLADLFDGRLAKYGIEDAQSPTATARSRCLTDGGCNYLWCWADKAGVLQGFESFMPGGWPAYILEAIATEAGLESDGVDRALTGSDSLEAVTKLEQQGYAMGIQGVPFFILLAKYGISGAQPPEFWREALPKIAAEASSAG